MNQSKFSLADLFSVLSVLTFGFACFLGANFLNIGKDKVWGMSHTTGCVVMALACALPLLITAFGAKLLKRTRRNFKSCFVLEIIFLILFVLFATFFSQKTSPFPHYFTVQAQKNVIINKLQTSIAQAEQMFSSYETYAANRENLYKQSLQSVVNAKKTNPRDYIDYGFDDSGGISGASQIDIKIFSAHADLFPTNYSDTINQNGTKEVATKWLQEAKTLINNWKPIGIVGVAKDIEKNTTDWLNTLVTQSQVREPGEKAEDFSYSLSFEDIRGHFTKLNSRPTPFSIMLAVLAYALMLLSWMVTPRSSGWPGLKLLFGLGKSNDKEL